MPPPPLGRPAGRRWILLAAALLLVALAVIPAVTTAAGQQDGDDHQDTIDICHFLEAGQYEARQARETDFYGSGRQGHGEHEQDIVPPFVIENPRPDDPSSFPGRNWNAETEAILTAGCVTQPQPETKVRICHATNSRDNPYNPQEPAIANNGDLQGGHLNHTGPVYPADNWGDIIPPYDYIDQNGQKQTFPGYNWSPEGQTIYQNGCEPPPPPTPKPITPILECVEATGAKLFGHFGYENPNATTVEPPDDQNRFSPPPVNRGQPTAFASGHKADAFQAELLGGGPLTWSLTGNSVTASSSSEPCKGSIMLAKRLIPADDTGLFSLRIDGEVAGGAEAVSNGDSTGTIAVDTGRRTVSETGASGTQLSDYTIETVCRTGGGSGDVVASANDSSVSVTVRRNEAIVCTITNTAKPQERDITPILECVLFNDGAPDVAFWGYRNSGRTEVRIAAGTDDNRFSPGDADRGQPDVFEPGRHLGVFQTPFQSGSVRLVWNLSDGAATASAGSQACNPTVELRKVTIPADDPGVFQLRIDRAIVATGGNGTTSGPIRTGIGEGTASETALPGTSLANYESSVECTRNGTVAVSVPGTKVDGEVRRGDVVVCTFTNRRKGAPPTPPPPPPSPPPPTPPPPPPPSPPPPSPPPPPPTPPPVPPVPPGPLPLLDLVVTKSVEPTTVVLGGRLTWTMTVTNRSAVAAADVNGLKLDDPRSYRTRLISLRASQGTCRPFTCDLGRLAPGASATVTAVTEATQVGMVVDIVRVGSEEIESNYRNNIAAALARVIGPLTPPTLTKVCRTLTAEPLALQSGRSSLVRVTARNRLGKPLARVPVRARGPGVDKQAMTDGQGIARFTLTPPRIGLVHFSGRTLAASGSQCRTLLGVVRAKGIQVTG